LQRRTETAPDKAEYWHAHVDAWQRSGGSQRDYCDKRGLALSTFSLWRRRLAITPATMEIVPIHRAILSSSPAVVIVLAGGRYRVEIGDCVRTETLRITLDVLESRG
jgi:hypothetical protein